MIFKTFQVANRILGMNSRNLEYILPSNLKSAKYIADNKLLAKRMLRRAGIPVPKTFKIITSSRKLRKLDPGDLPESFVLKPNQGLGGEGIMVTYTKKKEGFWLDNDLKPITWQDIKSHVQDILDGQFSLANAPDVAFFEERLVRDSIFKHLAYRGVPDIRIIVYNRVPVLAMLRLPTRESHGKANLHLGGIGVGIDIATGKTTYAMHRGRILRDKKYTGIKMQNWDDILRLSIEVQKATRLGYMGIDIVLAKKRGPVVLEVNARPGLSIQTANLIGLKERLMRVHGLEVKSVERGLRLTKSLFGKEKDEEVALQPPMVKIIEEVTLYHKDNPNKVIVVKAKVDSGARSSSIDYELAEKLGFADVVAFIKQYELDKPVKARQVNKLRKKISSRIKDHPTISSVTVVRSASGFTVRVTVPVKFLLQDKIVESEVNVINRKHLTYDMIVGRLDLEGFFIKPH